MIFSIEESYLNSETDLGLGYGEEINKLVRKGLMTLHSSSSFSQENSTDTDFAMPS